MFEQELVALRATMDVGFMIVKDAAFGKIEPAGSNNPVIGVTVTPKTSSAVAGTAGNRQLTATVAPQNATNKTVTYSIAPVTSGLTVSSSGNIAD